METEDYLLGIILALLVWLSLFLWRPPRCVQTVEKTFFLEVPTKAT